MPRKPEYKGSISYASQPIAGVTLYQDRKDEPTFQELLEKLSRTDIEEKQKEELLAKLDERIDKIRGTKGDKTPEGRNLKRYLVDPETGKVDVDEEGGEYTYKDALLLSASIKGKGGQFEDAINLINAARTLAEGNKAGTDEKPKEFYVDLQTAVIVHDPENGEYSLSEARAVSQSMQRNPADDKKKTIQFLDSDGKLIEAPEGQPIIITKKEQAQPKTYFLNENQELVEQEAGKPILIKVNQGAGGGMPQMLPFPVMGSDGHPVLDKEGKPVYANLEPMMKYLGFLGDQRRADERHNALLGLAKTVRENVSDGVAALKTAAAEAKGTGKAAQKEPQVCECSQCHTQFKIPQVDFEKVACPSCQREYSREEVLSA